MVSRSLQLKFVFPVFAIVACTTLFLVVVISAKTSNNIEQSAQDKMQEQLSSMLHVLNVTDTLVMERVKGSMKLLKEQGQRLPAPYQGESTAVNGRMVPELLLGGQAQTNNFELVDRVTSSQGGSATLFSKVGSDFVRISTNVQFEGKRAIGTLLDPNGLPSAAIRKGQAFYGQVDILGNPYLTGYEPILDEQKRTVGIWYVGYKADMQALQESIAKSRILNGGFVALLDDKGQVRFQSQSVPLDTVQRVAANHLSGWVVKRETFSPWGFTIIAAYPEDEVSAAVKQQIIQVAAMGLALSGALMGLVFWLSRSLVVRPLNQAVSIARRIAAGDLSSAPSITSRNDEIGDLVRSLGNMQMSLRQMVGNIAGNAQGISILSSSLSSSAEEVAAQSEQQSGAAASAAAALEELSTSIGHVSVKARESFSLAQDAGDRARLGSVVVEKASAEMRNIADSVGQSSQRIASLGQHSARISIIVGVIKSIAEQTNLLALNAAIEAARAGEHGRGFAVVADEVRGLAERTAKSTVEITTMIGSIQSGTEQVVETMRQGQNRAHSGVEMASEAGHAVHEISGYSEQVVDAVNSISAALEQQNAANHEIAVNVADMAIMSEKNTFAIQQVALASRQLQASSNSLQATVDLFKL
ncbi:Cache 3/Cache 2 fusion domain-containing protein [Pseudomonas gingeri]|uniref:Cache 3/Cache 2 fusion domain-containing protein n=2 Tax=Pseudomonas gingeri TaxID=117681 RepID=A0A7Y7WN96_9PSED|nr:methyl-accepting chemotaxis protein [Pseudomonas gingeri]NWB84322.1 Cache 3/Cache 2 fusion domain-containing protein [Pseudomonas gingeri]